MINEIIFGAAVTTMLVGGFDVVREANPSSLGDFFEKLISQRLIGRLSAWWLIAALLIIALSALNQLS
jgi:hypothetical protein